MKKKNTDKDSTAKVAKSAKEKLTTDRIVDAMHLVRETPYSVVIEQDAENILPDNFETKESSVYSVRSVVENPEESSANSANSAVNDVKQDSTQARLASLIRITPELMSRVTGYSESTCKKVLLDCYPNRDITEFINQQTSIFLKRVRNVLYNVNLYNALDCAMVGKKIKDPEHMRLFVELQNLGQLLNGGK